MNKLLESIVGAPLLRARVREVTERFVRLRDVHHVWQVLSEDLAHITSKSGALLQAQGIFVVVAIYMQENGWPRVLTLTSLLLLIVAALAVMTNLRTVLLAVEPAEKSNPRAELEVVMRSATLVARRGAVFNVALYMTFLSILLMVAGAISQEL